MWMIVENKLIGERSLATVALNKDTREKIRLREHWHSKSIRVVNIGFQYNGRDIFVGANSKYRE